MSYEEMDYLNSLTAKRGNERCRRESMAEKTFRWGGWMLAGVILALELAVRVF